MALAYLYDTEGTVTSEFVRQTTDGVEVRVRMIDGRASAWVAGAEYLGESSTGVLALFMQQVCITERAELRKLLADCRRAKGDAAQLNAASRTRARREARRLAVNDPRNHALFCACHCCRPLRSRGVISGVPSLKPRRAWVGAR